MSSSFHNNNDIWVGKVAEELLTMSWILCASWVIRSNGSVPSHFAPCWRWPEPKVSLWFCYAYLFQFCFRACFCCYYVMITGEKENPSSVYIYCKFARVNETLNSSYWFGIGRVRAFGVKCFFFFFFSCYLWQ